MPTERELSLISGDVIRSNGVTFRIIRSSRFSVDVEVESTGEIQLNCDDAPSVAATATDPNAAGVVL